MKTSTLHWVSADGDINVDITVSEATLMVGLRRQQLVVQAQAKLRKRGNEFLSWIESAVDRDQIPDAEEVGQVATVDADYTIWLGYCTWYPACMAATTRIANKKEATQKLSMKMDSDDFMELPEQLVNAWLQKVYDLNPLWQARRGTNEEGEAEAPVNESGLTNESESD